MAIGADQPRREPPEMICPDTNNLKLPAGSRVSAGHRAASDTESLPRLPATTSHP